MPATAQKKLVGGGLDPRPHLDMYNDIRRDAPK
jgi:hypothetical protein